jgi:hypothetical protein
MMPLDALKLAKRRLDRSVRVVSWILLLAGVSPAAPTVAAAQESDGLEEIVITAREPRFVAPTLRDRIGRIWAPVFINGQGPFKLVLDTGASHSGVTEMVASTLRIPLDQSPPVIMHGVTGTGTVPSIHVATLNVGELDMASELLPILPDAFGGAQGILGSEGLANKRIFIDFRRDRILITYSRGERSERGFLAVPFHSVRGALIVIEVTIGGVRTKAIIDTGGQVTIGNLALKAELLRSSGQRGGEIDAIQGATLDVEEGVLAATPPISVGRIVIRDSRVTFADMAIFKQWQLTHEPALIIGMDVIGLLDALVIDYRRHELQIRTADSL